MIKYNETYRINNGKETIVFSAGNDNTVTGEYNSGTISGTLVGNVLKGTYQNNKNKGVGLINFEFHDNGFDAQWRRGLEPGPMRGKWEGLLGADSSSEFLSENTLKRVHYMTIYLDQDAEGNELAGSENAADFIYTKINSINTFIKDRIDNEVQGFLYEEFITSSDSFNNRSIHTPDLLEFLKNKLKTDVIKGALEAGDSIRVSFIFDPKEDELEIWKSEFLELSELLENTLRVFGHHSDYEDIVLQAYDNGDYDTGIIACDLEVFEGLSLSSYMKSESDYGFPQDSIFELSNYSL